MLISPHFDDAVLSCAALLDREDAIDVLTVFTGAPEHEVPSAWDTQCGFDSASAAIQARAAEDRAAFHGLPHRAHHLGLLDIGYIDRRSRSGTEADMLLQWVRDWIGDEADAPSRVILPVGAGRCVPTSRQGLLARGRLFSSRVIQRARRVVQRETRRPGAAVNPDHAWVRDTLTRPLCAAGIRLGFYEEHPYLLGQRGDAAARRIGAALGVELQMMELPVDSAAKVRRITAYRSQLEQLEALCPELICEGQRSECERYWVSTDSEDAAA